MNKITIEFFHDVICSFCFPMSYRMRQVQKLMPEVEIRHRSFALVRSEEEYKAMFGSRAAAKEEIVTHWEQANRIDDLHRFNIDGMKKTEFPFPTSMKPLRACKAAFLTAGDDAYWDVFDALQKAFFVDNRNIEDEEIIGECVKDCGLDLEVWKSHYNSDAALEAVEKELELAKSYEIRSVPCLVVNGTHPISGVLPLDQILHMIREAGSTQV